MTRSGGACLARPYIPPISNGFPFISAAPQGFATDTVADQMTAQTHSYPPTQDPTLDLDIMDIMQMTYAPS